MRISHKAFSLVELLSVAAIISILAAVCMPVLGSILGTRGMTRATSEIYDLVELARSEAMTTQGYAYLCFDNRKNDAGNDELHGVLLSAKGGKAHIALSSTALLTALEPASRVFKWENVRLAPFQSLGENIKSLKDNTISSKSLADQKKLNFEVNLRGTTDATSFWTIVFSPQGYVMFQPVGQSANGGEFYQSLTANVPYEKFVDIGLIPSRGGVAQSGNPDQIALLLNGANGHLQVLRK